MDVIEKVEKNLDRKIPCILKDEEGGSWAAHGLILSAYNHGYHDGRKDFALTITEKIEKEMVG